MKSDGGLGWSEGEVGDVWYEGSARVLFPPHKQSTPCWQDCGAWSLLEVQAGVGVALGLLALWPPTVTHAVVVRPGGKLCIWSA